MLFSTCYHDDFAVRQQRSHGSEDTEANLAAAGIGRQPEVQRDNLWWIAPQSRNRFGLIGCDCHLHLRVGETPTHLALEPRIIFDDEKMLFRHATASSVAAMAIGSRIVNSVPMPT